MLITIPTYTEPAVQLTPNTSINEPPQTNEDANKTFDEIDESSGFAHILAGLLQNTEKIQTDIPPVDLSALDFNAGAVSSADELSDGQEKLNLFEDAEQAPKSGENEISGSEINEELLSAIAGVENIFNSSEKTEIADIEDFQQEILTVETDNDLQDVQRLAKTGLENEFTEADFLADIAGNEGAMSETEMQNISLLTEKDVKDRALAKKDDALPSKEAVSSLQKKPEGESHNRLDEMRSRSRRDKVTFEVRDMRTETEANAAKTQRSFSNVEAGARRSAAEVPVRELTLELRLPDNNGSAFTQGQTIWETKSGNNSSVSSALENLLARELHQNFNGDIVRHASIALRDGGEGTIKIALRPESLGNVKIHLEMTENKITGHIVVDSKEALNAFRKEITSLEQAFRDAGFSNADLNLSMTADGQNAQGREQDASSFIPRIAASRYDDLSPFGDDHDTLAADVLIGRTSGSINMLA